MDVHVGKPDVRAVAYYLPQFHPVPENDAWWGPGFTEWTNVARARPLFPGHRQPRVPADLGFYDLRVAETRQRQADMAAAYGVHGFAYWHYWFGDQRRLLERPFQEVLRTGEPDFPFCLAWANHTWSGIWDGAPDRVLVRQTYPGIADERRHFEVVLPALHDKRAIRIDGHPIFLVFNPGGIPDAANWLERWRKWGEEAGLPGIHFLALDRVDCDALALGFDGVIMSQVVPPSHARRSTRRDALTLDQIGSTLTRRSAVVPGIYSYPSWSPHIPHVHRRSPNDSYPVVLPRWDNTPRSGRAGKVFIGATPRLFGEQVMSARRLVADRDDDRRLIFIKSWNEWAEGNYLEPDLHDGHSYLQALSAAVREDDHT